MFTIYYKDYRAIDIANRCGALVRGGVWASGQGGTTLHKGHLTKIKKGNRSKIKKTQQDIVAYFSWDLFE